MHAATELVMQTVVLKPLYMSDRAVFNGPLKIYSFFDIQKLGIKVGKL